MAVIGLLALVSYVRDDFVQNGCLAKVLFGPRYVSKNNSPNQVVFVATTDSYGPPIRAGQNPQAINTRNVGVEAHIWGAAPRQPDPAQQADADHAVCDALVNQTVLSLNRGVSPPGLAIKAGKQRYEAGLTAKGAAYVLQFSIQVPILNVRFPDLGIDQDVVTWRVADPAQQDVTPILDVDPSDD